MGAILMQATLPTLAFNDLLNKGFILLAHGETGALKGYQSHVKLPHS